ncbi:MAG: acyltransferase [Opitutales bacterium]|nr:acyltransferase [Opitutales bacterium]
MLIHTVGAPTGTEESYLLILTRGFINFPVAVFFFLSGFFNKSTDHYFGEANGKFVSRVVRLLVPYIFWTTFYLCVGFILCKIAGKPFDLLRIPKSFLAGTAAGPLYFLHVLLQLTIITPILVKIIRSESKFVSGLKWGLLGITPLYILALYAYDFSAGKMLPHYNLPCFAWFTLYYLGLLCANGKISHNGFTGLPTAIMLAFTALFIAIWEGFVIYGQTGTEIFSLAISQIRFGSVLFSLAIINLILCLKSTNPPPNRFFSKLGDYSFGIYAFHMFWMTPLAFVCSRMIFFPEILPFVKIMQGGICVGITFLACKGAEKIIGTSLSKLIGIR